MVHSKGLQAHPWVLRDENRYLAWNYGQDAYNEYTLFIKEVGGGRLLHGLPADRVELHQALRDGPQAADQAALIILYVKDFVEFSVFFFFFLLLAVEVEGFFHVEVGKMKTTARAQLTTCTAATAAHARERGRESSHGPHPGDRLETRDARLRANCKSRCQIASQHGGELRLRSTRRSLGWKGVEVPRRRRGRRKPRRRQKRRHGARVYPTALGQQNKNEKRRTLFPRRRRRRRGRGWRTPYTKQDYQQTLGFLSSTRQRLRPLILITMQGRVTGPEALGALRARARPTTARGFWRVNTSVALF